MSENNNNFLYELIDGDIETGKVAEKPTFEEVDDAICCEHHFMPIDSTGLTLACTKCGFVVKKKDKD